MVFFHPSVDVKAKFVYIMIVTVIYRCEIMMPVLGKDATKLYDRYHKYVSLSLLDACFVGKVKKRKKASKAGEDGSKDGLEGDSKPVGEDGEDDNKAGEDAGESESHSSHGADEGTGEVDKHWREV